ncbi:DHH family phosphoesterase [Paenisporosarcina indica]|uniref:DHH family phosphoesterase n=1 Tax=Paenisporosarcina indica TaxID=650093 RepID=UPI0009501510|nr:oligoribonuclease [Paenisporosarcina indica]
MYRLLSHNDLDGVGCGILAKIAFDKQVKVKYNSVSSLDREVELFLEKADKNSTLFITDLSVNEENEKKLEAFYQAKGNVKLIDHHKTALHLNNYDWGHVIVEVDEGMLTSATSLYYEFLVAEKLLAPTDAIAEFVELIRQYDTWEWEKNENFQAQRLNALFYLITIEEFEEKIINRLKTNEHFSFDEFETKILDMEDNKIERYIRRKKREIVQLEIGGLFAGIVYAESYHSELGNELGKAYPHLDYIAIINMGGKRLGFRTSHDDVDVSEVAGQFGGGGHAKASGCSLTDEAYKQYVVKAFHLEPLREDAHRNRYNVKQSTFGSLYKDRKETLYFLHPINDREWAIEQNQAKMEAIYSSFIDGEEFLKRNYAAWLVRDDHFVNYIMDDIKIRKHNK